MTQPASELIRAYYEAFNANDMERFPWLLDEDVVHDINQGGRKMGRAAFAAFTRRMGRCYREQIVDVVVLGEPIGRRAAAEFTVLGEYISSDEGLPPAKGQLYQLAGGSFFEIRDERIARVTNCYNVQDWLRQATTG